MTILSPRLHGYFDYVVVVVFLIAPTVFRFFYVPAALSYTLAIIHLSLTLLTASPLGLRKAIPFTVHGVLELLVSFTLVTLPWLLGFAVEPAARNFYVIAGVIIFLVWSMTDYKAEGAAGAD